MNIVPTLTLTLISRPIVIVRNCWLKMCLTPAPPLPQLVGPNTEVTPLLVLYTLVSSLMAYKHTVFKQ